MTRPSISVAVPVAVDRGFTYVVGAEQPAVVPGSRVLVPFGRRVLTGVVRPVEPDLGVNAREIEDVVDSAGQPALSEALCRLCEWVSEYYLAPPGEAYRLALPGMLSEEDVRRVVATEAGVHAMAGAAGPLLGTVELGEAERRLLAVLCAAPGRRLEIARFTSVRPRLVGAYRAMDTLVDKGLCEVVWPEAEDGEGRTEIYVRRTGRLRDRGEESELLGILGRSKQRRALLEWIDGGEWFALAELRGPFPRVRAWLDALAGHGLVELEARPRALDPFAATARDHEEPRRLTSEQQAALEPLLADLSAGAFASSLLHGITGSGKTEIYLQVIAAARARGRGAIVLVPEIALTPQLADRFRARFGDEVVVLHSGLTIRQRVDSWHQIRSGRRPIVIGARSAVFAPVPDLAVVVVDEEHDASFKQEEGVRYNARDVALVRGRMEEAVVVLGSATPSLETHRAALQGRHRRLRLVSRPTPRPLPEVELLSLRTHRADPQSLLTARLRGALVETQAAGEQAILFLNRRGFAPTLLCEACGEFRQCPDCSAPSMTFHLARNRLLCHLCGHVEAPPEHCPGCGAGPLSQSGVGTERVEVALAQTLPGLRVLRLDRDAARGRRLLQTLARFRAGEADVLVGTQMLSKGHDFPGVTLVGILQADHGLGLPDPRAAERVFQLLTQVAGRAGRGSRPGRVVVQAWRPEHPAIAFASRHDYDGFVREELAQRELLGNPPFGHLALLRVSGPIEAAVKARMDVLAVRCRDLVDRVGAGSEGRPPLLVRGPIPSPLERINGRVRWQLLVRAHAREPLRWVLQRMRPLLGSQDHGAARTLAVVDVDPQNML